MKKRNKIIAALAAIGTFILTWSIPICLGGACYSIPLLLMALAAAIGGASTALIQLLIG